MRGERRWGGGGVGQVCEVSVLKKWVGEGQSNDRKPKPIGKYCHN
jgi:hypothetical protein